MPGCFSFLIKNLLYKKDKANSHEFPDMLSGNRGSIEIDSVGCTLCGKCVDSCPVGAISSGADGKSLYHDSFRCIVCGTCTKNCPANRISIVADEYTLTSHRHVKKVK